MLEIVLMAMFAGLLSVFVLTILTGLGLKAFWAAKDALFDRLTRENKQ